MCPSIFYNSAGRQSTKKSNSTKVAIYYHNYINNYYKFVNVVFQNGVIDLRDPSMREQFLTNEFENANQKLMEGTGFIPNCYDHCYMMLFVAR